MLYIKGYYKSRETEERPFIFYDLYSAVCEHNQCSDIVNFGVGDATKPQLASHQYWVETSQVFLSSCTLRVDRPGDFRVFIQQNATLVRQIRRLLVHASEEFSHTLDYLWQDALNAAFVGRLTSLEGVSFAGQVRWSFQDEVNVRGEFCNKKSRLLAIVQSFQQHKLKKECTAVAFKLYPHNHGRRTSINTINTAIREALLQHHPLRRSKRGL